MNVKVRVALKESVNDYAHVIVEVAQTKGKVILRSIREDLLEERKLG